VNKPLITLPWHWLPPLVTLSLVLALHIDVPYYDQWDLLPLLHAYYQGTLQWHDLLQPHNGHILLLPRIVMLCLATQTQWNTLAEVLFSFACMLANWFLFQLMAATLLERSLSPLEKIAISLLVFSLTQAQNWLWGWQLQIPLALMFILCGICSLLYIRNDLVALVATAICGGAATFSFAGSLPFWIAVIPILWQRQRILLLPWILISGVCILVYANLIGLLQNTAAEQVLPDASEILRHARNTLAVLGNLVARFNMFAAAAAGFSAIFIVCLKYSKLPPKQKSLALTLLIFSAGSALLVSLSRSGLGDEQMLASRYGTLTLPLWITMAMLLIAKQHTQQKIINSIGGLLLFSLLLSDAYSIQDFQQLHKRLQRGSAALAQIDSIEGQKQIAVINPRKDHEQALQEVHLLQQYHFSFYRRAEP
jgi:hypothetical protein